MTNSVAKGLGNQKPSSHTAVKTARLFRIMAFHRLGIMAGSPSQAEVREWSFPGLCNKVAQ